MKNTTRNNLTMGGVFVLLAGLGVFWYLQEASALDRIASENQEQASMISEDVQVTSSFEQFIATRDSLKERLNEYPKKLIFEEEPTFSLSYLNWLVKQYNLDIDFDFILDSKQRTEGLTTMSYTLKGESDYRNFCALNWYLSQNPLLYKFNKVLLRHKDGESDQLAFEIQLESYSLDKEWETSPDLEMLASKLDWANIFQHNAFNQPRPPKKLTRVVPRRTRPVEDPSLVNVRKAQLIAIAANQIYVRTEAGEMKTLNLGGKVRGGRLMWIDQKQNIAEFELRSGIRTERFRLKLEYR